MSFPNIPDIEPNINLTLDDSINLLLTSIALEEISLSKLIDAETGKILLITDECKHKASALQDVMKINKSVDDTLKNIIKLQMLLQFKLEKVEELRPTTTSSTTTTTTSSSTTTTTTTSSSTTTTTTTKTTTSTTTTRTTTTKKECACCLVGKGNGRVSNCADQFYGCLATLKVFLFSSDVKNSTLYYMVRNDCAEIQLYASSYDIKIQCCCQGSKKIVAYGRGCLKSLGHSNPVNFKLQAWHKNKNCYDIRLEITALDLELIHDSGMMQIQLCS